MKIYFSYETRCAFSVATAVAEEIQGHRPVMLSVSGNTFRFEGGIVVKVNMIDLDQFTEVWRTPHTQQWVVTHCDVRYPVVETETGEKVSETWDWDRLTELKGRRPWYHPHVVDIQEIKGIVGVFYNTAADDGFLSIDPDYNNQGHYTLVDSVEYRRFVDGDLARAEQEAKQKLARLTA